MTIILTGCDQAGKTYFLATLICIAKKMKFSLLEPDCIYMQDDLIISSNSNSIKIDALYIKNSLLRHHQHLNVDMIQSWEKDNRQFSFIYKKDQKEIPITFVRIPEEKCYDTELLHLYLKNADGLLFFIDGISLFTEYIYQIKKGFNTFYTHNQLYDYLERNYLILLNIVYYWKLLSLPLNIKTAIIFSKSDCYDPEIKDHRNSDPGNAELSPLDKKTQEQFFSFLYNLKGFFSDTHFFKCATYGSKSIQTNKQNLPITDIRKILDYLIDNPHGELRQ